MSRGSLSIGMISHEFNVTTDQIVGHGGSDSPAINIPVKFDLVPISYSGKVTPFEVLNLKAELRATDKNLKVAEANGFVSYKINSDKYSYTYNFIFSVNNEILNRIEKYRKDNIPMQIMIYAQVGLFGKITISQLGNNKLEKDFITGFEYGHGNCFFHIEQSLWVKILAQLGYANYRLIELPTLNEVIPEEYSKSIVEFEEARKYFLNGDYDKTVAHCRSALDPFYSNKEKFAKLKEFIKSKSEFEWANIVLAATEEWLDKIIKATSSFSSKVHHAPSVGHFSRTDAEVVLMITTGIIAYIGKIEYRAE